MYHHHRRWSKSIRRRHYTYLRSLCSSRPRLRSGTVPGAEVHVQDQKFRKLVTSSVWVKAVLDLGQGSPEGGSRNVSVQKMSAIDLELDQGILEG